MLQAQVRNGRLSLLILALCVLSIELTNSIGLEIRGVVLVPRMAGSDFLTVLYRLVRILP